MAAPDADASSQSLHEEAWNRMLKDPDFASAIKAQGLTMDEAHAKWQAALAGPAGAATKMPDYTVTQTSDGAYVHHVDGQPVLRIEPTTPNAARQSQKIELLEQGAIVAIDTIILILAAIGVNVAMSPETKLATKTTIIKNSAGQIIGKLDMFEEIANTTSKTDKAMKVARWLRSWPNFLDVVKEMFTEMSWWEKALIFVNLLASIALMLVTGGASLLAKIAALAFAAVVLLTDVATLIVAFKNYQEPAPA
jgi:hypothetical protein